MIKERRSELPNFIGQKFGRLTVLDQYIGISGTRRKTICLCKCECLQQTVKEIPHFRLESGKTKSCGCLSKEVMSQTMSKDFTGMIFGKWTVLQRIPPNKEVKEARYICQCSCEDKTISIVRSGSLSSGNSKSCGCTKKGLNVKGSTDLTGMQFGRWTLLERIPKGTKGTHYLCICSCEKKTMREVSSKSLTEGKSTSCGCHKDEMFEKTKERMVGENHPSWNNGAWVNNVALYDTYVNQLEPMEECRRDPENYDLLQVKCSFCKTWFNPKATHVRARIKCLNNEKGGENRFYCSTECKKLCPVHNQKSYPKGFRKRLEEDEWNRDNVIQSDLRERVIARDGEVCVRCGATKNLICHHIEGTRYNPIESADDDLCFMYCSDCHELIHSEKGCRRSDLQCKSK